jgi:acyl dehydratase
MGGEDRAGWPREEQRGLWYEDLEPGVVYVHQPGRTMTEYDNILFSTLSMNPQGLHVDFAFAEELEPFHKPLVNSMFTLATLVGMSVSHLTRGTIVANLGFTDIRFPSPLFHGDTVYGDTVVRDKRLSSSRPTTGIVTFEHTARKQDGSIVAVAVRQVLMRRSPAATANPPAGGPTP